MLLPRKDKVQLALRESVPVPLPEVEGVAVPLRLWDSEAEPVAENEAVLENEEEGVALGLREALPDCDAVGHADALRQLKGLALAELVLLRLCVSVTVPHADPVLLRLCVRDTVGLPEKQAVAEKVREGVGLGLSVPRTVGEAVKIALPENDAEPVAGTVPLLLLEATPLEQALGVPVPLRL